MPRPERPLDTTDGVLAEFAADLRALRDQAGRPGYRMLATRAHYSATTLSDAAGGRDLPSLAVTLAYVRACDGDIAMWERRWHAVAARLATRRPATEIDVFDRATPPYAGLAAFEPGDADRFFGRDDVTEELVRRVQERRFVAVFGASGAGKSSVLRAGLVARARVAMPVMVLTPGQRPVEECAVAMAMLTLRPAPDLRAELNADPDALHLQIRQALADRPEDTDLLLVVDQFEEVFTLCHDECERLRFVTALVRASQQPTSRLRVVLGVRTDFYTHCARIPELVDALRDAQVLVGSMNPTELRGAVSQPAVRAGCAVEGDLLAAVIADCAGESAVLPLLSHALLETWRRRRGNTLTLSGYQAAGGIAHAISHTAEQVYEGFDDRSRQLAKSLFLRLTALGDGTEDTKRRLRRDELDSTGADTTAVLERLAQARLITLDHEWVEITHEALIRCWPRLRDWLAADRDGLRVHRQLTQSADTWLALDRDTDALYRGSRLATAQEWHTATDTLLNVSEREFLTASLAAQASDRAATRRRTRRLRQLVALLSVLLLVAGVAVAIAVRAGQSATTQRDVAVAQTALLAATTLRTTDPALSLQLTLAAYRLAASEQARSALLNALGGQYARRLADFSGAVAFSPDGRLMVTADGAITRIWDLTHPHGPVMLDAITGPTGYAQWAGFSPDGRILTVFTDSVGVRFWEVTDPRHPRLLTTLADADSAMFSADGHLLITAGPKGPQLWDSTDPGRPVPLATLSGQNQSVLISSPAVTAAISPDGHTVATQLMSGRQNVIRLWDTTDPRHPVPAGTVGPPTAVIGAVMGFSPTAPVLAVGTGNGTTVLWDISNPHQPNAIDSFDQSGATSSIAFGADGRTLATGAWDGSVSLWDISTPDRPRQTATFTAAPGGITTIGFEPGGHSLAIAGPGPGIELINLPQLAFPDGTQQILDAAISPDGRVLASAGSDGQSVSTELWDLADPNQPTRTTVLTDDKESLSPFVYDGNLAFSPHGTMLATADHGLVHLWNVRDQRHPGALAAMSPIPGSPAAFGPDGRMLAVIAHEGDSVAADVLLWDVGQPSRPRQLADLCTVDDTMAVAFSPVGHLLAVACGDETIELWNTTSAGQPRLIATIPAGTRQRATVSFDSRGQTLVSASLTGPVELWNVADPVKPRLLTAITVDHDSTGDVALSPDGRTLAVSGPDQTIQLWDLADLAHPRIRAVLTDAERPIVFHPDGHTLAVVGTNGLLQLRETDPDQAAARICALNTATMAHAAWDRYLPGEPYQPPCP